MVILLKKRNVENGHPYKSRPAPLLSNFDVKQDINTQDAAFPSDVLDFCTCQN